MGLRGDDPLVVSKGSSSWLRGRGGAGRGHARHRGTDTIVLRSIHLLSTSLNQISTTKNVEDNDLVAARYVAISTVTDVRIGAAGMQSYAVSSSEASHHRAAQPCSLHVCEPC
jgi:hypothetical protein